MRQRAHLTPSGARVCGASAGAGTWVAAPGFPAARVLAAPWLPGLRRRTVALSVMPRNSWRFPMSTPTAGQEVHLVARPAGEPQSTDFALVEASVTEPGPGQVLVRNDWISVDPYMRGRMNDVKSYVP